MKLRVTDSGFALFSIVLIVAIISVISLAMVNAYLGNTRATVIDLQRIKADQLMASGVNYAALSLASPRAEVSGSAIPSAHLVYSEAGEDVIIEIHNEAGFIDLLSADRELLASALLEHGVAPTQLTRVIESIRSLAEQRSGARYRSLRRLLPATLHANQLLSVTSLHNGQSGVHPALAPESVLTLVPGLSAPERERILKARNKKITSLVSNPVNNDHFSSTISAYYRVSTSVVLQGQRYSRVQIIKMINQHGKLYELQARF